MHRNQKNKKKRGKHRNNNSSNNHHGGGEKAGKENIERGCEEKDISTHEKSGCQNGRDNLAYEIKISDIMGRYLVASRDLEPGDLIVGADPLVVGPWSGCEIICIACYHSIDLNNMNRCSGCRWPICSTQCQGLYTSVGHTKLECSTLATHCKDDNLDDLDDLKNMYLAIVPLRCLLTKSTDPDKWEAINSMVAHNDIRRKKPILWNFNQLHVVDRIRIKWNMPEYTEEEIHTLCGILEVNAFEVGPLGASLRALYSNACLLAHDCTPNTTHSDDDKHRLSVRAARSIKKGEAVTLSYAYTLQSTQKRREHLMETKFFACVCQRCTDPRELGTFAGAMLCPRCTSTNKIINGNCKKLGQVKIRELTDGSDTEEDILKDVGIMLPLAPLEESTPWKCDKCPDFTMSSKMVGSIVSKINDEYDSIDVNDVEGYEEFLEKYKTILHPNHYLFLSTKLSLSQLYGKVDSHLIHKMSPKQLQLKRDICRDILKVFDILEPGYSRLRGTTLYELHAPIMVLTTRDYEKKTITKSELRTRLIEVAKCLNESAIILGMDPKDSSEGIMATAAKEALKQIKDWERILGKII